MVQGPQNTNVYKYYFYYIIIIIFMKNIEFDLYANDDKTYVTAEK